jgi:hypothetical protein
MSFGFQTKNESGFVTVDADYRNLVLREKVTGTFTTQQIWYGLVRLDIDRAQITITNATNPICFIYTDAEAAFVEINITGSTYTWTISSNTNGNFTAYIFDVPITIGDGHGIKVYDQSAELVFDSENKYMKVVDYFSLVIKQGTEPSVETVRTYNDTGTYAVGVSNPNGGYVPRFDLIQLNGISCSPTSITITDRSVLDSIQAVDGMGEMFSPASAAYMVIDVTGY